MKLYFFRNYQGENSSKKNPLLDESKRELEEEAPSLGKYIGGLGDSSIWTSKYDSSVETASILDDVLKRGIEEKDFLKKGDFDAFRKALSTYEEDVLVVIGHGYLKEWTEKLTGNGDGYDHGEIKLIYLDDENRGHLIWSLKSGGDLVINGENLPIMNSKEILEEFSFILHENIEAKKRNLSKDINLESLIDYYDALGNIWAFSKILKNISERKSINKALARYGIEMNKALERIYYELSLENARKVGLENLENTLGEKIKDDNEKYVEYINSSESNWILSKALKKFVKATRKADGDDFSLEEVFNSALYDIKEDLDNEFRYLIEGDFSNANAGRIALENYIYINDYPRKLLEIKGEDDLSLLKEILGEIRIYIYASKTLKYMDENNRGEFLRFKGGIEDKLNKSKENLEKYLAMYKRKREEN